MKDTLIRGTSADGTIRVFCAVTTELVNEAHNIHGTSRVATAALGRLLTGAAIMGAAGLKSDTDSITLRVDGDGALGQLIAVTDSGARVRGCAQNPKAELELNGRGKLDVGGAVGGGYLSVIKDLGLREPYIGQIPLVSGEIAEDLTAYYAQSEQIPTAISLGVLVSTEDNSVIAAGGYMIQLMPGADGDTACAIEENLAHAKPVTKMIEAGMSAQDIIFEALDGFSLFLENKEIKPEYKCGCSKEKMERALISIGAKELKAIIDEQGEAQLCCHFCNNKYRFGKEELEKLLARATRK